MDPQTVGTNGSRHPSLVAGLLPIASVPPATANRSWSRSGDSDFNMCSGDTATLRSSPSGVQIDPESYPLPGPRGGIVRSIAVRSNATSFRHLRPSATARACHSPSCSVLPRHLVSVPIVPRDKLPLAIARWKERRLEAVPGFAEGAT